MAKGITRERIVEAALHVLDDGGIDAVTLRAVAARLDVRAPALYWHVKDKQQLLDEMGTEIQRRVQHALEQVNPEDPWTRQLGSYAAALRQEYRAHRDGARVFSGTRLTDPAVLRAQEPWLQRWTAQGATLVEVMDAVEIVTSFVVGFVIEEQEREQSARVDPTRYATAARDNAVGDDAPLVRASAHEHGDADTRFTRQLEAIIEMFDARFR